MIRKLFNFFTGRHTFFALFFTVSGTALAWCGRLSMPYVALIGAVQSYVFAHSLKESHFSEGHDDEHKDK